MRFDVVTLFPELFAPFLTTGITRRAYSSGAVDVHLFNPRDVASGNYRRVDDRPFGGGPGMVMMVEPLLKSVEAVRQDRAERDTSDQDAPVILLSPAGEKFGQQHAASLAASKGAIFVCGRYEGIDQRFIHRTVDAQWSLGDFVLSGGEIAALAMIDAAVRLLPGALNHGDSSLQDSFQDSLSGLLDSPHYTRPDVFEGEPVPPVLMSGNHALIARWRREQSLALTLQNRPDLIAQARARGLLSAADEKFLAALS